MSLCPGPRAHAQTSKGVLGLGARAPRTEVPGPGSPHLRTENKPRTNSPTKDANFLAKSHRLSHRLGSVTSRVFPARSVMHMGTAIATDRGPKSARRLSEEEARPESTQNPPRIHTEPTQIPHRAHSESTQTPSRAHPESDQTPNRIHTNNQQPTVNNQQPTTNNQQPTASSRPCRGARAIFRRLTGESHRGPYLGCGWQGPPCLKSKKQAHTSSPTRYASLLAQSHRLTHRLGVGGFARFSSAKCNTHGRCHRHSPKPQSAPRLWEEEVLRGEILYEGDVMVEPMPKPQKGILGIGA